MRPEEYEAYEEKDSWAEDGGAGRRLLRSVDGGAGPMMGRRLLGSGRRRRTPTNRPCPYPSSSYPLSFSNRHASSSFQCVLQSISTTSTDPISHPPGIARPSISAPNPNPMLRPTRYPTSMPTRTPTRYPTGTPTNQPTRMPTTHPTRAPTPEQIACEVHPPQIACEVRPPQIACEVRPPKRDPNPTKPSPSQ